MKNYCGSQKNPEKIDLRVELVFLKGAGCPNAHYET